MCCELVKIRLSLFIIDLSLIKMMREKRKLTIFNGVDILIFKTTTSG